jgi:hypothetical protein
MNLLDIDCTFCVDDTMEILFVALTSGEILTCFMDSEGNLEFKNVYNVSLCTLIGLVLR